MCLFLVSPNYVRDLRSSDWWGRMKRAGEREDQDLSIKRKETEYKTMAVILSFLANYSFSLPFILLESSHVFLITSYPSSH